MQFVAVCGLWRPAAVASGTILMWSETGQCMEGVTDDWYTNVLQKTCNISNELQRWSFKGVGDGYYLVMLPNGLCLNTGNWFPPISNWVDTDACTGRSEQLFQLRYDARGGAVTLSPKISPNKCLEMAPNDVLSLLRSTNVIGLMLNRCDTTKPQRFYLPLGEHALSVLKQLVSPLT